MTDTPDKPPLPMGLHAVDAPCPRCGVIVDAFVFLTTTLTTPSLGTPTLRVKAQSKPVEHDCRHGTQTGVIHAVMRHAAGVVVTDRTGE